MDSPKDWKKKYQYILDELESKEETWGQLETLLRKAIGRLAIAGLGIDQSLDVQLRDIKNITKQKEDDKLSTALDQLSDVLNVIDGQETQSSNMQGELATLNTVMTQLLSLLTPPEQFQPSFERVKSHLPPKNTDSILTELANELNLIMLTPNADTATDQSIDEVILSLLDRLSLVPSMNATAQKIQNSIKQGVPEDQWPAILDNIANEVSTTLQLISDEKNELSVFIAQVTQQLAEITGFISEDFLSQKEGISAAHSFHQHVNERVCKMNESVLAANDVDSLKQILGDNIGSLKEYLEEHLQQSQQRFEAAEKRNKALCARVVNMEKETQALKKNLEKNKKKMFIDALTQVPNRLAYNEHIKMMMARWSRFHESFSYAILDIDHFKRVNDTYGHNVGDKVLQLVATLMQKNIRETDTLFRIGGEEFVLIFPNTPIAQATPTIDKVRKAVSSRGFRFKDEKVVINLSAGVTEVTLEDSEESIYERADQGLYKAKETGRNKVVSL